MKKHGSSRHIPANIDIKIADYKKAIKELEDDQRNKYMAHLAKDKSNLVKPPPDFRGAIPLAVHICDELNGERVEYKIGSEWSGIEINLRESFE